MRFVTPVVLVLSLTGCVSFVGNQPRLLLVKEGYDEDALRSAIIRAFEHRRIAARGEDQGRIRGESSRKVTCGFSVEFGEQRARVITTGPTPADDASRIDERCDDEAARLAKAIEGELTRPERVALKNEKRRAKQEAVNARNQAIAAQADLYAQQPAEAAQQYAEQQAAAQQYADQQPAAQPPQQPGSVAERPVAAPAPQPARVQNNWSTNNVQTTTTIVNNAPPPVAAGPRIQPNTCCVRGKAYLCPNTMAYASACVQQQGNLASTCPASPAHDQFCPR